VRAERPMARRTSCPLPDRVSPTKLIEAVSVGLGTNWASGSVGDSFMLR
jgi:hypothetical protein